MFLSGVVRHLSSSGEGNVRQFRIAWIPASAGMTGMRVDLESTNSETLGLRPRVRSFFFTDRRCPLIRFRLGHIAFRNQPRVVIAELEIR